MMLEETVDCVAFYLNFTTIPLFIGDKNRSIPLDILPWKTDMGIHTNVVYICKIEMMGFVENVPFFNLLVHQTWYAANSGNSDGKGSGRGRERERASQREIQIMKTMKKYRFGDESVLRLIK